MRDPHSCDKTDSELKGLTFLRYVVMGVILLCRTLQIRKRGKIQGQDSTEIPYCDHPKLTSWMNNSNFIVSIIVAGCIFIQSEGVGFATYFSATAFFDNCAIFLAPNDEYCQYVVQVALYSMSLVTFLPTCVVAYSLQGRWYDKGNWRTTKSLFLVLMFAATLFSFLIRLWLVNAFKWDRTVYNMLSTNKHKVLIAAIVPPVIDVLQSVLLVASALKTKRGACTQRQDEEAGIRQHSLASTPPFVSVEGDSNKSTLIDSGARSIISEADPSTIERSAVDPSSVAPSTEDTSW